MEMYAAFILPSVLAIIHIILSLENIQQKGFWLQVLLKEKQFLGCEKQLFISAAEGSNSIEDGALPRKVMVYYCAHNWGPQLHPQHRCSTLIHKGWCIWGGFVVTFMCTASPHKWLLNEDGSFTLWERSWCVFLFSVSNFWWDKSLNVVEVGPNNHIDVGRVVLCFVKSTDKYLSCSVPWRESTSW
jgi:hypothetical protein